MNTNLSELWKIARQYGRVSIHTLNDGDYSVTITFSTIDHTSLEAKSGFHNKSPEEAMTKAIKSAQQIVDSISNMAAKLPERKLLA